MRHTDLQDEKSQQQGNNWKASHVVQGDTGGLGK